MQIKINPIKGTGGRHYLAPQPDMVVKIRYVTLGWTMLCRGRPCILISCRMCPAGKPVLLNKVEIC